MRNQIVVVLMATLMIMMILTPAVSAVGRVGINLPPQIAPVYFPLAEHVEICWKDGVPSVITGSNGALLYGLGWAMAENTISSMQLEYAKNMGISASFFGSTDPGDPWVANDFNMKMLGVPEQSAAIFNRMPRDVKPLITAFTKGVNDYVMMHREELEIAYPDQASFDLVTREVTEADVISAYYAFVIKWGAEHMKSLAKGEPFDPEDYFSTRHSNEWALGGALAPDGKVQLNADPHITWMDPALWTHLSGLFGDQIKAVGFHALGAPFHALGLKLDADGSPDNGDIVASTYTAGPLQSEFCYRVQQNAGGTAYFFNGRLKPFHTKFVTVELPSGLVTGKTFKYTVHGPVIHEEGQYAFALSSTMDESADFNTQFYRMLSAENIDEWFNALELMHWPGGNLVFGSNATDLARQHGYILYGRTPMMNDQYYNYGEVIDGSTSASLWSEIHPLSDMPQVYGDQQPLFINNNVGIDHVWPGFAYQPFEENISGTQEMRGWDTWRQQRAEFLLAHGGSVNHVQNANAAVDKKSGYGTAAVPLLVEAYEQYGSQVDDPRELLPAILSLLENWTDSGNWALMSTIESQEMVLFTYWLEGFSAEHPGLFGRPNFVPQAFTEEQGVYALQTLLSAFYVVEAYGFPHWGDVHRIHRATGPGQSISFPVSGGSGILRAAGGEIDPDNDYQIAVGGGQTCNMLFRIGATNADTEVYFIKAMDNCVDYHLGNVSTGLTEAWAAENYKQLPTTEAGVRAAADRIETIVYHP